MAKLGLFQGDYMQQDKEYVYIKKRSVNRSMVDEQTAAIKLAPGHSVKKISE